MSFGAVSAKVTWESDIKKVERGQNTTVNDVVYIC